MVEFLAKQVSKQVLEKQRPPNQIWAKHGTTKHLKQNTKTYTKNWRTKNKKRHRSSPPSLLGPGTPLRSCGSLRGFWQTKISRHFAVLVSILKHFSVWYSFIFILSVFFVVRFFRIFSAVFFCPPFSRTFLAVFRSFFGSLKE